MNLPNSYIGRIHERLVGWSSDLGKIVRYMERLIKACIIFWIDFSDYKNWMVFLK